MRHGMDAGPPSEQNDQFWTHSAQTKKQARTPRKRPVPMTKRYAEECLTFFIGKVMVGIDTDAGLVGGGS